MQNVVIVCDMRIIIFESIVNLIIAQIFVSSEIFYALCPGQSLTCLGYYDIILSCTERFRDDILNIGICRKSLSTWFYQFRCV